MPTLKELLGYDPSVYYPKQNASQIAPIAYADQLVDVIGGVESGNNPNSSRSPKGARGQYQIMPDTAPEIAASLGEPFDPDYERKPEVSRRYAQKYLEDGLRKYGGDPRFAAIYYHAGPSGAQEVWNNMQKTGVFEVPRTPRFYDGISYTADYVDRVVGKLSDSLGQKSAAESQPNVEPITLASMGINVKQYMPKEAVSTELEEPSWGAGFVDAIKKSYKKNVQFMEEANAINILDKRAKADAKGGPIYDEGIGDDYVKYAKGVMSDVVKNQATDSAPSTGWAQEWAMKKEAWTLPNTLKTAKAVSILAADMLPQLVASAALPVVGGQMIEKGNFADPLIKKGFDEPEILNKYGTYYSIPATVLESVSELVTVGAASASKLVKKIPTVEKITALATKNVANSVAKKVLVKAIGAVAGTAEAGLVEGTTEVTQQNLQDYLSVLAVRDAIKSNPSKAEKYQPIVDDLVKNGGQNLQTFVLAALPSMALHIGIGGVTRLTKKALPKTKPSDGSQVQQNTSPYTTMGETAPKVEFTPDGAELAKSPSQQSQTQRPSGQKLLSDFDIESPEAFYSLPQEDRGKIQSQLSDSEADRIIQAYEPSPEESGIITTPQPEGVANEKGQETQALLSPIGEPVVDNAPAPTDEFAPTAVQEGAAEAVPAKKVDRAIIVPDKFKALTPEEKDAEYAKLHKASETDQLTGLMNRTGIDRAAYEMGYSMREGDKNPPPVVLLDLDKFKNVNDSHGHQVGDDVLQSAGLVLSNRLNDIAFVGRHGGEEFLIIPKQGVSKDDILQRVESARSDLSSIPFNDGKLTGVSFSAGFGEGVKAADDQLYKAKDAGRAQTFEGDKKYEPVQNAVPGPGAAQGPASSTAAVGTEQKDGGSASAEPTATEPSAAVPAEATTAGTAEQTKSKTPIKRGKGSGSALPLEQLVKSGSTDGRVHAEDATHFKSIVERRDSAAGAVVSLSSRIDELSGQLEASKIISKYRNAFSQKDVNLATGGNSSDYRGKGAQSADVTMHDFFVENKDFTAKTGITLEDFNTPSDFVAFVKEFPTTPEVRSKIKAAKNEYEAAHKAYAEMSRQAGEYEKRYSKSTSEEPTLFQRKTGYDPNQADMFSGTGPSLAGLPLFNGENVAPPQQKKGPLVTGDLFEGTKAADTRTQEEKKIEAQQREKDAVRPAVSLQGLPMFDANEREAMITKQEDLFKNVPTVKEKEVPKKEAIVEPLAVQAQKSEKTEEKAFDPVIVPGKMTYSAFTETKKKLYNGKLSIDDFKMTFSKLVDSENNIKAELSTNKKDALQKIYSNYTSYMRPGENKSELISSIYHSMLSTYGLSRGIVHDFNGTYADSVKKIVDNTTQKDLDAFAEEVDKNTKEYIARRQATIKAIKNPETLAEFKTFLQYKKVEDLTPEQRRTYEDLTSTNIKEKRKEEKIDDSTVEKVDIGDTGMQLIETKHTQKGHDLFVVRLNNRVDREIYNDLNVKAKKLGGYYSSYKGNGATPGFQFTEKAQAEKFMALKSGDVSNADAVVEKETVKTVKRADKLRTNAEKIIAKADEGLNQDRQTNTARRAAMASSADAALNKQKRIGKTMLNIAAAIDAGEVKFLDGVSAKTHIEQLDGLVNEAKRNEVNLKYPTYSEREKHEGEPATEETIDKLNASKAYYPNLWAENLSDLFKKVESRPGSKAAIKKLYFRLVGKDSGIQVIKDQSEIDALEKLTSLLSENDAKYNQIVDALERHRRLKTMGFENPIMLSSALREYVKYRGKAPVVDKIKELERSLIGKNVGVDFFPTPKPVAEQMVRDAGITEGMKVLEPSAGNGNIADAIRAAGVKPDVVEISSSLRELLQAKGYNVVEHNFMDYNEGGYDAIVMNPPFGGGADIEHVRHAYDLLKPGGKIVAIMGEGAFFRSDRKASDFRDWLEEVNGSEEKLPQNTFQDKTLMNTTGVNARIVNITKPESSALFQRKEQSQIYTTEFKAWFGDWENDSENASKVVDESGKPLVVYHGTDKNFTEFRTGLNKVKGEQGMFFSTNPEIASKYSGYDELFPSKNIGSVKPVYLNIEKLKTVDLKGGKYGRAEIINKAKEEGFDGILLKNHYDAGGVQDQYVVFSPNQIKSATGNTGVFNPSNPDIRFQRGEQSPNDTQFHRSGRPTLSTEQPGKTADPFQFGAISALAKAAANQGVSIGPENIQVVDAAPQSAGFIGLAQRVFDVPIKTIKLTREAQKLSDMFNGFRHNGVVYLNDSSTDPSVYVVMHEVLHDIFAKQPYLKTRLMDFFQKQFTDSGNAAALREAEWYRSLMKSKELTQGMKDIGVEEVIANYLADSSTDPKFWDAVHAYSQPLARRLLQKIAEVIDRILRAAKVYRRTSEGWFKDAQAVRGEMVKMMAAAVRGASREEFYGAVREALFMRDGSGQQQDQTRTAEFKRWFGDWENDPENASKVVDENGKPLVVYRGEHGKVRTKVRTTHLVPTTDEKSLLEEIGDVPSSLIQTALGSVSFVNNPETAATYAESPNNRELSKTAEQPRVIPAYLSIRNPVIQNLDDPFVEMGDIVKAIGIDKAIKIAIKHSYQIELTNNWDENFSEKYSSVEELLRKSPKRIKELYLDAYFVFDDIDAVRYFKDAGYDGAIHMGNGESMDDIEYKVFSTTQIKSATGNTGAFDPSNPDIRYQRNNNTLNDQNARTLAAEYGLSFVGMQEGVPGYPGTALFNDKNGNTFAARTESELESRVSEMTDGVLFQRPIADTFYSPTLKAVQALKQDRGTGDQFFAMISKAPGVKESEWKWMGLDDFLKGKQSVTKKEIEDFVRQNQVTVQEKYNKQGDKKIPFEGLSDEEVAEHYENYMDQEIPLGATRQELIDEMVEANENDMGGERAEVETKYQQYTLPGGENYREVLLTLPLKVVRPATEKSFKVVENGYKSSHWEEPNVIAHTRLDDRTGPNGEKVLFVEEIQSDWARDVRDKGVRQNPVNELPSDYTFNEVVVKEAPNGWSDTRIDVKDGSGNIVWKEYNGTIESAKKNALIDLNHNMKLKGVPNQPFLKNWQELTLKRILRMAAEEGYNRVAWINGEQTADRYNLAKVAESINHSKNADGTYNFHVTDKIGRDILDRMNVPESELAGIFGKDVANKIVNRDGEFDKRRDYSFFTNRGSAVGEVFKDGRWYIKWQDGSESGTYLSKEDAAREADHVTRNYVLSPEHNRPKILKGTDLKIGGEWAHNLYDVQIPKFFEKYGKKWGTKVEPVSLGRDAMPMPTQDKYRGGYFITQDGPHFDTIEEAREWSIKNSPTQQSITITDEMRDSVMHEGQPLFARRKQELLPDGSVPKKKYVSTKLRRPKAEQIAAQEQIEDLTQYIKDRFKVPDIEGVTEERRPLFEKHWDNIATRAELEKELMQYEMYSDAVNFKYHHEGLIKKELKRKEIQQKIYDYARKINLVGEPRNQVDTLMLRTTGTSRNFFKALNIMDTVMEKRLQAKALEEVRLKFDATRKRIAAARAGRQPAPWTAEHTEAVEKYLDQFMFMSAKEEKAYEEAMASLEQNKENFDPEDALGYDSKELAALTEMVKKNLLGMSSSDLLNVMAELTQIERTGKTAKMLADAQAAAKLASDGFFAGVEIRRVTKNSEKSLAERSLGRKERGLARNAKEFFMDTMDPQRVIEWITGNFTEAGRREASVFKQNTWNKLRDASVKSVDSMIKATKHIREIHKPLVDAMKSLPLKYAIKAEFTDGVNDRKIPLPGRVETHELTLNEMMFVYANSKNEGNILHLFGSGWTREGMLQVENTIPEVAKDVVDKMHRYYDVVQYPKMNGVFRRLFGIDMPRIENYFPIRNLLSAKVEDSMLSEMLARFSNKSSVQKGMTKARQGSAAPFREMDYMGVVFANLRQSEHFVANAEAVRDVRKFLNYDDVAQALANRDKDFDAKAWSNDFLKRMAYGKVEAIRSDAVAKTADALRYYYSCYALGWNPKTWVKQWSSLFVGGKYVENKARLAQSALKMMAQRGNMIEDIKSKSLFMKNRNSRFEREIQEMFDKHESTMFLNTTAEVMNKIRQVSMWGISTSDMISSSILWDAKYTEEINKGIPQEQAVRNADEAIEKSFAGGGLAYLTRGQTSQGLTRYLTMFTSDLAKAMNTQYETMRTARQNGLSKTAIAVMMTSLIPAALIFTVDTFDPEKFKDDPEGFLGYILSQIYGAFPLFNQIGDGLYKNLVADPIRKLRGAPTKPLFQGSSSIKIPWMDIADELYSAAGAVKKAIGTKEGDDVGEAVGKAVKASVGAAGMLTGLLPRQPINTAQAAYGLITGTEDDWRRLLYSAGSLKDMSISGGVARGILGNKEISAEQYGEMSDAQREIVDQKIQKIIEKKERLDELKYSRE